MSGGLDFLDDVVECYRRRTSEISVRLEESCSRCVYYRLCSTLLSEFSRGLSIGWELAMYECRDYIVEEPSGRNH
ncbi:MAG: hypothetical protein QXU30_07945 [Sulfolobales archaeon]